MDTREELKRIKERENQIRRAKEIEERFQENEWAKQQMEEFGDIVEAYFIKNQISSYFFEIKHGILHRHVSWLTDSSVSRKYLEIDKELTFKKSINRSFDESLKRYLYERGIKIKTKLNFTTYDLSVWLEVI